MVIEFPVPFVLRIRSEQVVGHDRYNKEIIDWVVRDWPVHGYIEGPSGTEEDLQGRELLNVAYTVWSPAGDKPTENDEVEIEDHWYPVYGRPIDATHGPFENPVAGIVTYLKESSNV